MPLKVVCPKCKMVGMDKMELVAESPTERKYTIKCQCGNVFAVSGNEEDRDEADSDE